MSISKPVGAMRSYLAKLLSGKIYFSLREISKLIISSFSKRFSDKAGKAEDFLRSAVTGGTLFNSLGFYYIGTIDSEVELSINPLCLGAHYMFGKKWKAEIGGGISYWMMSLDASAEDATSDVGGISISGDGGYLMFYTSVGFRYQNPEGGINVKLGLSPTLLRYEGESAQLPMPHIGLGYSF